MSPRPVQQLWLPVGLGLLVTPPLFVVAMATAAFGHGNMLPSVLLFPFGMLSARVIDDFTVFLPMLLIQFPLYGKFLGHGLEKGPTTYQLCVRLLIAFHLGAVMLACALVGPY